MAYHHELLVSASDAESLAFVLGNRRRSDPLELDAANALADLLMEARLVPHESLPPDRVAMNSHVTYEEGPDGVRRSVTLVHPIEANAAEGRISVLSPIGRALIGRRPGSVIVAGTPGGRELNVRIVSVTRRAP